MKKLAILVLGIAALSAFAGTCVVQNTKLTEIDGDKTLGGEIKNDTDVDFLAHKVLVAFLDGDNNVLQTKSVEGCLRSLQSGTSDFFAAASTEDPDDVEKTLQRLDFSGLKVGQTVDGELNYSSIEITRNEDSLVVTGNIKNDGSNDLEDVRVCAVVRDEDGKVLTVFRGSAFDLDEDATKAFSLTVNVVDDVDDVATVDLWADGTDPNEDDAPIDPQSDLDNDVEVCDDPATNTPTPTGTLTPTNTPTATTTPPTATNTPVDTACD